MPSRHHEVSRIEAFSDAVFGFALTLLVVSLEPLKDVQGLFETLHKAGPFALTFAMVCWIWWQHNQFFRRYGLQDAWTAALNAVLLFVVLIYVYPLRFLAEALTGRLFGVKDAARLAATDGRHVMLLYSAGVLCLFATFVFLHLHARRQHRAINLSAEDLLVLRFSTRAHLISMLLAVVSIGLLFVFPGQPAWGGLIYALMGPLHGWNGAMQGRARTALERASAPAEQLEREDKRHDQPQA